MEQTKDVIIENTLENIGSARYGDYLAHALCTAGRCTFTFNGQDFELREGSLLIVRKGRLLENIMPTADFAVPGLNRRISLEGKGIYLLKAGHAVRKFRI